MQSRDLETGYFIELLVHHDIVDVRLHLSSLEKVGMVPTRQEVVLEVVPTDQSDADVNQVEEPASNSTVHHLQTTMTGTTRMG